MGEFSIPLKPHKDVTAHLKVVIARNVSTGGCIKIRAFPVPNGWVELWTVVLFLSKALSQNHLAAPKYPRLPYNFC